MIYTDLTRKALQISFEAHKNQKDKAGVPYVFHPYEVASRQTNEYAAAAALLHDTLEDTSVTVKDLEDALIPRPVIEAVILLTHTPEEPYLDYVRRIRTNPIARSVKIADLRHNSDATRMAQPSPGWKEKRKLYEKALAILEK